MVEMFMDRAEAGRQLTRRLGNYDPSSTLALAIPRGGVTVAVQVALGLGLPLDIIVPKKLPIPWNPEAGFGAVTSDGEIVLNHDLVRELELSESRIKAIAESAESEIRRQEGVLRQGRPTPVIAGKRLILLDDGLASGYTMLAAIQSVRRAGGSEVIVAVPVASESAAKLVRGSADELICLIESHRLPFAVADYYVEWHDLTDQEVLQYLK